jgi:hypothetical protein
VCTFARVSSPFNVNACLASQTRPSPVCAERRCPVLSCPVLSCSCSCLLSCRPAQAQDRGVCCPPAGAHRQWQPGHCGRQQVHRVTNNRWVRVCVCLCALRRLQPFADACSLLAARVSDTAPFWGVVPTLTDVCCAVPCCVVSCCAAWSEAEVVPVRQIDNSAVLTAQLARLSSVKQSRDDTAVAAALQVSHSTAQQSALAALCVPPQQAGCLPAHLLTSLGWSGASDCQQHTPAVCVVLTNCVKLSRSPCYSCAGAAARRRLRRRPAVKRVSQTCWSWQCR